MLTTALLTQLARNLGAKPSPSVVAGIVENERFLIEGGIDTPARIAEFLAQACLETDYFRVLEEYASGAAYEGRKNLGNTVAGDGRRFKGRGIFQCTGRANYTEYGRRLGLDLVKEPTLAARPDVSVRIAVMYWNDKGLNVYADKGDTRAISRAINRGSAKATQPANHESDRVKIALEARRLLADAPIAKPVPTPAPAKPAPVLEPATAPILAGGGRPEGMPADFKGNQWPPTRNDGTFQAPASEPGPWAQFASVLANLFRRSR